MTKQQGTHNTMFYEVDDHRPNAMFYEVEETSTPDSLLADPAAAFQTALSS